MLVCSKRRVETCSTLVESCVGSGGILSGGLQQSTTSTPNRAEEERNFATEKLTYEFKVGL
jgi:hypothetical protein